MKTAEEKAIEYTDNEFAILPKSMAKEDMRHRAQKRFRGGLQRGNEVSILPENKAVGVDGR